MSIQRNYGTGVFGISLGGVDYGVVLSSKLSMSKRPVSKQPVSKRPVSKRPVSKRPVSEAPVSHGLFTQRSMGDKELTPIEIEVALSGGRMELLGRFAAIFDDDNTGGAATRFDGEIAVGDESGRCVRRQRFGNGLVSSFAFGNLDVTSKAPATFKVTIEPEQIENVDGDRASIGRRVDARGEDWLASTFRVSAPGLTTSHVTKVYGWITKQTTSKQYVGAQDLPELIPGNFEFPRDGKIDILAETADWRDWHRLMVIDGDNLAEKDIVVEYLDTQHKNTLFTVTYHECGITHLTTPGSANNEANSASATATLYCNRISFA